MPVRVSINLRKRFSMVPYTVLRHTSQQNAMLLDGIVLEPLEGE